MSCAISDEGNGIDSRSDIYHLLDYSNPEIRLLKLLPSRDIHTQLEGLLVNVYLHDEQRPSRYEAVSYVWGNVEPVSQMVLNGISFPITRNLDVMLRHLRLSSQERILWVDALCINQKDKSELSHQVRLMKEIYRNCSRCLAWLLECEKDGDLSQEQPDNPGWPERFRRENAKRTQDGIMATNEIIRRFVHQLATTAESSAVRTVPRGGGGSSSSSSSSRTVSGSVESPGTGDSFSQDSLGAITSKYTKEIQQAFTHAPIWERVWTMQELINAPWVTLVAGRQTVDATFLGLLLRSRVLNGELDDHHIGYTTLGNVLDMFYFGGFLNVDRQRQLVWHLDPVSDRLIPSPTYTSTLWDILALFAQNKATDPRDHIYGLLGMVTEDHGIIVDYSKNPVEVFTDATISMINSLRTLDILCQVSYNSTRGATGDSHRSANHGLVGLPTWVPDYTCEVMFGEFGDVLFAGRDIYCAGGPYLRSPEPYKAIKSRFLGAKVAVIGEFATDVTLQQSEAESPRVVVRTMPRRWLLESGLELNIVDDDTVTYLQTGEPTLRAYWRTLLMDCKAEPSERLNTQDLILAKAPFKAILRHDAHDFNKESDAISTVEEEQTEINESVYASVVEGPLEELRAIFPRSAEMTVGELREIFRQAEISSENEAEDPHAANAKTLFPGYSDSMVLDDAFRSGLMNQHIQDQANTSEEKFLEKLWKTLPNRLEEKFYLVYKHRRFAISKEGLFCMVPAIKAGDVIAVAEGAKVPLLLRSNRFVDGMTTYSIVGTAYVHGFMNGEAAGLVNKGELEEEMIYLE